MRRIWCKVRVEHDFGGAEPTHRFLRAAPLLQLSLTLRADAWAARGRVDRAWPG